MLQHSCFVLLLELYLSCYDWSTMIPAINVLQILWSSLWWCMSPQKLFFLFITYLLEDEQELSLGMLIHCKCIYNFWCSMLGFIYFLMFCPHFGVLFHMISWTNLLKRATVLAACFLLFLVPGKSENEYSRIWTGQKPKLLFSRKTHGARKRVGEGPQGGHNPLGTGQPRPRQGWSSRPRHPLGLSFHLYITSDTETLSTRLKFHERVCSRCHLHP